MEILMTLRWTLKAESDDLSDEVLHQLALSWPSIALLSSPVPRLPRLHRAGGVTLAGIALMARHCEQLQCARIALADIDQAAIDMALAAPALPNSELTDMRAKLEAAGGIPERCKHDHFNMTHPGTNWRSMIEHAEKIGLGTSAYELIED